jgi:hypothetical protein
MKKSLLLKRISVLLSILFATWHFGAGQALLVENFDYSVGSLPVSPASVWVQVNSGNAVQVISGSLSYTGYLPGVGNSITIASGLDYKAPITPCTSGSVYAAFLINVTTTTTAGDYIFHFMESTTSTYYKGRVWLKQGTTASKFYLGVAKSGTTPAVAYSTTEYDAGTTYLIVLKYQINAGTTSDDIVTLYVNPTLGSTEPATPTVTASDNTTTDGTSISLAALRQPSASTAPSLTFDGLRVATSWNDATSDLTAPVPTFNPSNATIDVATNIIPTITYDEPILKTDGSAVLDADLASIVTFKQTNAAGVAVSFTATIDAGKKVITITPSTSLSNGQVYYLAVGPVKDASGNQSTGSNATFTTIGLSTPTITVTAPNGGEKFYSGDMATVTWTTTNFAPGENVKIEAWVPDEGTVWAWIVLEASTPNDGSQAVMVGPDAAYGTQYLIRITGVTNGATDMSDNPFTCIATATTLATLRQNPADAIVKYKGIATVTYARTSYNQKYIQDGTAAILIHDPTTAPGFITGTYNIGDGITNVEGKITLYNGLIELVPQATTGEHATGTAIVPPEVNIMLLTSADQSKLVKIKNLQFANPVQWDATGLYIASKNYDLTGLSNLSYAFRTAFSESDYIGTAVPTGSFDAIVLVGQFNAQMQVTPRSSADILVITGIEENLEKNISLFPVPASTELRVRNIMNVNTIEILDASGRIMRSTKINSENEIIIPVNELKKGMYFIRFTTNSGSVVKRFIK